MSRRLLTLAATTGLAVTGTLVAPATADAATARGTLALSVRVGQTTTRVLLTCDPAGGTHPDAATACTEVAGVHGNLAALTPQAGVACADVYVPAIATAAGRWRGRTVGYRHTFGNTCQLHVATGAVFRF